MIEGAIATAIIADTDISERLAVYENGRAIFTRDVLPEDCKCPAILITPITGRGWGTRAKTGGDIQVDVSIYFDRDNMAEKDMRTLARDLWNMLNRAELPGLAAIGLENCGVYADPPIKHSDDEKFPGYTIRVRGVALNV